MDRIGNPYISWGKVFNENIKKYISKGLPKLFLKNIQRFK